MAPLPPALRASVLAAVLASPAASLCDGKPGEVPCFPLASGHRMPAMAMGTAGLSLDCVYDDYTCSLQRVRFAVESFLHIGGTHIDGANDYRTQVAIAEAFKSTPRFRREDVFVTTKCPGPIGFEGIMQCADSNLQMLGEFTDKGPGYIDLLLIHFPFLMRPECVFSLGADICKTSPAALASKAAMQDSWRAMELLKKLGVVRSIGVSDYNTTFIDWTREIATEPIDVHQMEWHPMAHDEKMLAYCKQHGIQFQAWSPLGGAKSPVLSHPVMKSIAAAHNVSTPQVALKWSLQKGVAVVFATDNPAHAANNLACTSLHLSDDEIKAIDAIPQPPSVAQLVI